MAEIGKPDETVRIKIDVLLKEYDALRAEIISRTNNRFAIAGFLGAVIAFTVTRAELGVPLRTAVFVISSLILVVLWAFIGILINLCGLRIAEIEAHVNKLAGDRLMEWQSDNRHRPFGWSSLGPFASLVKFLRKGNRKF